MFTINQIIDLQAVNPMLVYEQPLEYGNKRAHVWTIEILSGGKPAELDGMQATVTWIRPAGPQEVKENPALLSVCMTMPAEIAGNRVRCVLDGGCYGGIGPAVGKMQLSKDGELTAAALMAARIEKNSADAIIDPAHIVPSIEAFLSMMGAMDEGTKAALEAAKKANTATDEVLASKTAAEEAVSRAQEAVKTAEAWSGAKATAETIPHGQPPTVTVTDGSDGKRNLHLQVPAGPPGPVGPEAKPKPWRTSSRYKNITNDDLNNVWAGYTFTAQADGFVILVASIDLREIDPSNVMYLHIVRPKQRAEQSVSGFGRYSGASVCAPIVVKKGDVVKIEYFMSQKTGTNQYMYAAFHASVASQDMDVTLTEGVEQ